MSRAGRVAPFALIAGLVISLLVVVAATPRTQSDQARTVTVASTYRGFTAKELDQKLQWMRHLAYARLVRAKQLKRTLLHRPSVAEAINLACVVYGNCPTLWRKASCETGGTFDPKARNNSSPDSPMGLFEFKPSTLATTPFARFSIWSPYVSSLAAGWMHVHGRGGEWQCR